ncbi:unnamed protein product [Durusdinium trenchii]|uniref:Uncharacterized protein n=1 Tax=Durusdinium trenchii TaxID=1381693 RepID=A0ABP0M3V2_9DINO
MRATASTIQALHGAREKTGSGRVVKSKKPLLYHVDAWSGYKTRNAVQPPSEDQRWPLVRRKSSTPRATSQVRPVPTLRGVAIAKV